MLLFSHTISIGPGFFLLVRHRVCTPSAMAKPSDFTDTRVFYIVPLAWYHYQWNGVTPARNLIANNRTLTTYDIIIRRSAGFEPGILSSTTHRTNHYTTGSRYLQYLLTLTRLRPFQIAVPTKSWGSLLPH